MRKSWVWILLSVTGLAVAARLLPVDDWLGAFLAWARGQGAWGPAYVAAAYVPTTLLFIPGWILSVGAGFAFGVVIGAITVSIGSVVATTIAFILGRTLLRHRIEHRIEGSPRWSALDRAVEQGGFKIVLLMRLSPLFPYNLMGYVFGVTKVRFKDHLLASWIGMLPGTVMYVYLGCAAENLTQIAAGDTGGRTLGQWVVFGVGLLSTIVVTVLVTRIARKAIHETAPELERAAETADAASEVDSVGVIPDLNPVPDPYPARTQ